MKITITENSILVEGHANYADHGEDIVCAAVSAILYTAQLGLVEVADNYPEYIKLEMKKEKKNV